MRVTVDDELNRIAPSQTAIAPGGSSVISVQSELNWEKNRCDTHLVRIEVATKESSTFTRGPNDRAPVWSPDGRYLAFLRKSSNGPVNADGGDKPKDQICAIPSGGGAIGAASTGKDSTSTCGFGTSAATHGAIPKGIWNVHR